MTDAPLNKTDAPLNKMDLARWAESLAGIARTGLAFTESQYERERYEEVLHVAAEIDQHTERGIDHSDLVEQWKSSVGEGVPGYVTPKAAVGAIVGNDAGELLLVQRADSGIWLYPTGWADIGYSPAEVAVKEVAEETGIECEAVRLIGVLDGMRRGFNAVPLYSLLFHCRMTGGDLQAHPLECRDVGFFTRDNLPEPMASMNDNWIDFAYTALKGEPIDAMFDAPRDPPWAPHDQAP